jgi:hypothetical protein
MQDALTQAGRDVIRGRSAFGRAGLSLRVYVERICKGQWARDGMHLLLLVIALLLLRPQEVDQRLGAGLEVRPALGLAALCVPEDDSRVRDGVDGVERLCESVIVAAQSVSGLGHAP